MLEANLDDLNPQVFGYVMDRLLEEGALDAFGVPVQMKKNRPGTLLTVLCHPEDASKLTRFCLPRRRLSASDGATRSVRHWRASG